MPGFLDQGYSPQTGKLMGATTATGLRLAVLVAVTLASPLHQARAQSGDPNVIPVLRDLAGVSELRSHFEIDVDKVRIVLLLSPT